MRSRIPQATYPTVESTVTPPSLGGSVCAFIEKWLVHSEGDYLGQPFRLLQYERLFIWECYELEPDGTRRYDRAVLGLPKGNGKTEIAAAIALAELAGPVVFDGWVDPSARVLEPRPPKHRTAPDIPIAAASYKQANILFKAAATMISEGPLAPIFVCGTTEITRTTGAGILYRVAAAAGTNDGLRPTFVAYDELHEWEGNKERVHTVLSNGVAKRAGAWELAISTAGWDVGSLLGQLCEEGKSGDDPRLLYVWWEPKVRIGTNGKPRSLNLTDPAELEAAIREANPAVGAFLPLENLLRMWRKLSRLGKGHEFRRYFLNLWVDAPEKWLADGAWMGCADRDGEVPAAGTPIVLGFDGSYTRDSTALVGATVEAVPYLFVVALQEEPETASEDWRVDIGAAEADISEACERWEVMAVACDPMRWQRSIAALLDAGLPMVEWPTHNPGRMAPACAAFEDAIQEAGLAHDGSADLARHVRNCVVVTDSRGRRITKRYKKSRKRIDLAVSAVVAYDMATRIRGHDNWSVL